MNNRYVSASRLESGRKTPVLLPASSFVDFRPGIDRVVIEWGRAYIRDGQGHLADQEVQLDLLTDAMRCNLERTPLALIGMKVQAVRACAVLSDLGRQQRLDALGVAWKQACGSALFVVEA